MQYSFFALVFDIELKYGNVDVRINSGVDRAILYMV